MATKPEKPGVLAYLVILAGVFLMLRLSVPALAAHPVGRLVMLVIAAILASFAMVYLLRVFRR